MPAGAGIPLENDIPARCADGFNVMVEHRRKVLQRRSRIGFCHECDVATLHRFDEAVCHIVNIRDTHGRSAGFQIQLSGELACVM